MSDSYTAWCEEQERNACKFSRENVNNVKQTKKFESVLAHAAALCKSAKFKKAESCENCTYKKWLNSKNICPKLGVILHETDYVCKHWNGTSRTAQQKPNEDAIAWYLISKSK